MQKTIYNLLKVSSIYIAILITLTIAVLSLIRLPKQTIEIKNLDKYEHCIAYVFLSFFWLLTVKVKKPKKLLQNVVVFCCIFYGMIIEILQGVATSYRTASYYDIIANSIGVLIGLLFFQIFFKKNSTIFM